MAWGVESWRRHELEARNGKVPIEGKCSSQTALVHDLERDGVGETEAVLGEGTEPAIHGPVFEVPRGPDHFVEGVLVASIEELQGFGRVASPALPREQRMGPS